MHEPKVQRQTAKEKPRSQSPLCESLTEKPKATEASVSPPKSGLVLALFRGQKGQEKLTFLGFSGVGASSTDASISLAGIHVS